ncbi:hypothetical protein H310_10399 [Aphanomyces invadans]|uniref:protein-serine/threonine phosphatase n=1 Tax=Aphanomyces invadans TaxID=157072 RepID=A0A024TRE9_9STRA|nr:hypothetical protein H310_10399 [Aphanomyces invadans]ETV96206.1 hypothetical protein H310_10399 [Aphanomyces invadans]|eukprot:XP_008874998.1 hypothetical protein H310_10399 [Aphanomyces invadans]
MGLCQGKDTAVKAPMVTQPQIVPGSSSSTELFATAVASAKAAPRSRSNAHAAAARLYCLLAPSDPLLDDIDFVDAPDVVAMSTCIRLPGPTSPFRQVAALAVQNKSFKCRMEDTCVIQAHLPADVQLYAIYDGHGSHVVSTYLAQHFHVELIQRRLAMPGLSMESVVSDTFESIDTALESLDAADQCGSTAVVLVANGSNHITVANCGDSHCLYVTADGVVARITQDHHVRNATEVSRIKAKHGMILNHRVSGVSKVTRAFGQHDDKDFVIAKPAITTITVEPARTDDECASRGYFVLMSDGISDVLQDQEIARYVSTGLAMGWAVDIICQTLVDLCKVKRARDNMSVVLVLT